MPAAAWLAAAPLFAWLALFVAAPALIILAYSFAQRGTLGGVVWEFTIANYAAALDPTYLRVLLRSVVMAGATAMLCLIAGYPVALYMGRAPQRWRGTLLMLVMVPFWTSFLIRTYAWLTILKSEGALNGVLLAIGIIDAPVAMLYTPGAVLLGLVYTFLPFMILPLYTSIEALEEPMLEAASDLGAGPWRTLRKVILPLTMPGIVAGSLFVFVPALGLFAVNDILGGGTVDMIGNVIENQFKGGARNWPFGAALSVLMMAVFGVAMAAASRSSRLRGLSP